MVLQDETVLEPQTGDGHRGPNVVDAPHFELRRITTTTTTTTTTPTPTPAHLPTHQLHFQASRKLFAPSTS